MVFFRKATEEERPKPAQELVELRTAVQQAHLPEAVAGIAMSRCRSRIIQWVPPRVVPRAVAIGQSSRGAARIGRGRRQH